MIKSPSGAFPPDSDQPELAPELLLMLDLLGQAPVMFHRSLVPVCGSVHGALWLSWALGQRSETQAQPPKDDGAEARIHSAEPLWFPVSRAMCEEGTGLTRYQQESARRDLRDRGILLEQRRETTMVAIDTRKLGELLLEQSQRDWSEVRRRPRLRLVANR